MVLQSLPSIFPTLPRVSLSKFQPANLSKTLPWRKAGRSMFRISMPKLKTHHSLGIKWSKAAVEHWCFLAQWATIRVIPFIIQIIECTFSLLGNSLTNNSAGSNGGAVYYDLYSPLGLQSNAYANNSASYGNNYASYPFVLLPVDPKLGLPLKES